MAEKTRIYEDIKEMVENELSNIAKKGEIDEKCLTHLDKLVDIIKDIDTITAMKEYSDDDGYSTMYTPHYYDGGNSYRARDMRGRYSRDDGYNMRYSRDNYSRGGYSRDGNMRDKLERMMDEAQTQAERDAIRQALDRM